MKEAVRTILVRPLNVSGCLDEEWHASRILSCANATIHNMLENSKVSGDFISPHPEKIEYTPEYTITLRTQDSSYDLSGFYSGLNKLGYAIQ